MSDWKKSRKITEVEGESSRYIDTYIDKSGEVRLFVQDFNQAAKTWTGDSEYEYATHANSWTRTISHAKGSCCK